MDLRHPVDEELDNCVDSLENPQKSPMISGSFAESDLQIQASYGSLTPCR